jgi:hypothetical protein
VSGKFSSHWQDAPRSTILNYKIPQQAWNEYEQSNFAPLGEAEAGNAGEQPAGNSLTNGEDLEGVNHAPSIA